MYFVDRKKINHTLKYMTTLMEMLETSVNSSMNEFEKLALERIAQNIIESMIDVGNSMIDGFIMRDPGSYDDIIDILTDEKVISVEMDAPLKEVIGLRKMLVRDFMSVNHKEVQTILQSNFQELRQFPASIEHYLTHELGPVSAFLPED
ncbi:DUF86 domain-containing protein [Paenisporosarcina sp. FSL H8-0542]|uniref:type VII toxin-antitoxin system HepT family RNase toxin n=1 Tax=unclassified Paenisporosarcina TaxID=2642018 RepID=UPI00034E4E9F|nr:DUF86 domain-containing protein [Paenisporosarcina sp. HGH0030]EPD50534.1 hypothetical protein HMPREF1210_02503 [Paenisporosarcina sp. HGH0030]